MMKYIALVATVTITFVGCSNEEENNSMDLYDQSFINFETLATKATINDVDSIKGDSNGFVVYGLEQNSSDWYANIDGKCYIYDTVTQEWGWEDEQTPLWPDPFNQMNFYAYYPQSAEGFSLREIAPTSIIGDVEVVSTILDQTDYLASSSGDIVSKPLTGMQPLSFVHTMAKISFSVIQDEGILTVIRQLGIENVINKGSYDYINSTWYDLSNKNLASFDDYVGSSGPFAKYGVEDKVDPIRIDGHYLMLIPQTGGEGDEQTPLWDGSVTVDDSGDLLPNGAYISMRYRTNSKAENIVGYAFRETSQNDTEWDEENYFYPIYKKDGGSYNGPLYVKVGFKLSSEQLNWVAGSECDYTLKLNETGGIYLSEFYYDVDGKNTKIRVDGAPDLGDIVFTKDISFGVTVDGWNSSHSDLVIM
ncbi:MAG: fimbrillin family protein [Rikenellaceae bacterium]